MNPPEVMLNQMFANNPAYKRAQEMSKGKTDKEIQQIAANLCKQRGIDMNAAYKQVTQMFGAMFNRK